MTVSLRVLHFDDDIFEIERVNKSLMSGPHHGEFQLFSAQNLQEFELCLKEPSLDVVVLDILDGTNEGIGHQLLYKARIAHPDCVVVMRSMLDDTKTIRESLALGADDFISKRTDSGELCLRIRNAFELCQVKRGQNRQHAMVDSRAMGLRVVGPTMLGIAERIPRIVNSAISSVFIGGETGTGKEVVASLFQSFLGNTVPFISINCGAVSGTLLESELFGHVKGSFTGASADRRGLIEAANGGWIFMDEVATLSLPAQIALLRVMENGEVLRVGSNTPRRVDVKFLSATNQNIAELVACGLFRKDLWQRLNEATIMLPRLADRENEVPVMVDHFCRVMKGGPYVVTKPTMAILSEYDWGDGNVRELRNCLRAMTEFSIDGLLTPLSIPERILKKLDLQLDGASGSETDQGPSEGIRLADESETEISISLDPSKPFLFDDIVSRIFGEVLHRVLAVHGSMSLRRLSNLIGVSRSTLAAKIRAIPDSDKINQEMIRKFLRLTDV